MLLACVTRYDVYVETNQRAFCQRMKHLPPCCMSRSPPVCVCVSLCALGSLSCLSSKPEIYSLTSVFRSWQLRPYAARRELTALSEDLAWNVILCTAVACGKLIRCTDNFKEFTRSENDHLASCIVLVSWLVSLNAISWPQETSAQLAALLSHHHQSTQHVFLSPHHTCYVSHHSGINKVFLQAPLITPALLCSLPSALIISHICLF